MSGQERPIQNSDIDPKAPTVARLAQGRLQNFGRWMVEMNQAMRRCDVGVRCLPSSDNLMQTSRLTVFVMHVLSAISIAYDSKAQV